MCRRLSLNTNNSAKILTGRYMQINNNVKRKVIVRSSFVLRTHSKHVHDPTSNYPRYDVLAGGALSWRGSDVRMGGGGGALSWRGEPCPGGGSDVLAGERCPGRGSHVRVGGSMS